MQTLRKAIEDAKRRKVAVGHFNISTIEALHAIVNAARSLNLPVIIGVSEGERDFVGVRQAAALVRSVREELDYPVFLNADHSYSFERVKEAIDAGYDAVIFDGAKLSMEENIKITKQCVEYARSANPNVIVEGELGYIGQSSEVYDVLPANAAVSVADFTTAEQAKRFVQETSVDLFSPAVGSIHGMLRGRANPDLDIGRIREISSATDAPLVLHGGSGLTDENFTNAIAAGISIIHINTEIRLAWKNAVKSYLSENTDEVAPYKILRPARQEIQKVVEGRLRLFNRL
jgi:fructose-bisphosphate aldolase class II